MSKKDETTEPEVEETAEGQNDLAAAEAKKNELVNFVANNLLNGITLSQAVTVIQQVVVRDAEKLVSDASPEKLAEIEEAYAQAQQAAQENAGE